MMSSDPSGSRQPMSSILLPLCLCFVFSWFTGVAVLLQNILWNVDVRTNGHCWMTPQGLPQHVPVLDDKVAEPINVPPMNISSSLFKGVLTAGLRQDNLMIGKSCRYYNGHWDCRDCGLSNDASKTWSNCTSLKPRGACQEFPKYVDWDTPTPQSHSFMDPTASHHATRNILSFYDIDDRYEQVPCTLDDDFCFDLSRCSSTGPMTVFAHGNSTSLANPYVASAAERYPNTIQQVFSPSKACLLVVTCDAHSSFEQLISSPAWNQGQNHFVWYSSHCFRAHYSRTFDKHNYAKAAIASSTLTYASIRLGYDFSLTQVRGKKKSEFAVPKDMRRQRGPTTNPRRWLLGYKGRIAAQYPHPWFQHRWLAYEFWNEEERDIVIDSKCWGKSAGYRGKKEYSNVYDYSEILWNSTFAFCPGGANAGSYRFSEALGLGAIPVVTAEFVSPFEPEIDWSDCVVRVSEARIVDLPRLLREMPLKEVQKRQRRCLSLFEKTMGWVQDEDKWRLDSGMNAFAVSLQIWAMRVKKAHVSQQLKSELERSI